MRIFAAGEAKNWYALQNKLLLKIKFLRKTIEVNC